MSAPKTLLIVGATGLLGAALLPALREGAFAHLEVTALVRPGSAKAAQLHALGVKTVEGSAEDAALLTRLAGQYDVVLDMADSSKPDITQALVAGVKKRAKGEAVLVHVTGTGNFVDGKGTGEYDSAGKFWDDAKVSDIAQVSPQMFNGAGDRIVLDAGKDILAYVLCAGGVFADRPGLGSYGVFNRLYANNAAQLGYTPYIGDGSSVMALLHVDDAVAALLEVLALAVDPKSESRRAAPEARWFNASGQAVPWKTIAEVYGKALGKAPKQVPFDQAGFMAGLIGSNMLVKDSKLTALGWEPTKTDLAGSITRLLGGATLPL